MAAHWLGAAAYCKSLCCLLLRDVWVTLKHETHFDNCITAFGDPRSHSGQDTMDILQPTAWQCCLSKAVGISAKKKKEREMLQTYMTSQILGFITASRGIRAAGRSWACVFFLMGDCCGCCLFLGFLTRALALLCAPKLCDEWLGWSHGPLQQLKLLCGFVASWSSHGSTRPCGSVRSLWPHLWAMWALLKQMGSVPAPLDSPLHPEEPLMLGETLRSFSRRSPIGLAVHKQCIS